MVSSPAVLILNPLSGFGIHQPTVHCAARERLIDVREVRTGYRAKALARDAVRDGAKALVAAGGDGTVSAVAAVAVEHDIPLVVVPCGTRNHFAKDCGADVTDPAGELAALEDGLRCESMAGRSTAKCFWTTSRSAFTPRWCAIRTITGAGSVSRRGTFSVPCSGVDLARPCTCRCPHESWPQSRCW
ncbi:MAG: acylglycerol kinase family protein [Pseudonocardiales bacterium]|nr:acylglycerol kinase family protein [Pseudonocardiales bacterium]